MTPPERAPQAPAPGQRPPVLPVDFVVKHLAASPNSCDQRKARDVQALLQLSRGAWAGRFAPTGAIAAADRTLFIVTEFFAKGLIWNGKPQGHDRWTLALGLRENHPLAMPVAQFLGPVPFNPHVTHRAFVPVEHGLPPEFEEFLNALRKGRDGGCCYARADQWRTTPEFDLARVAWQVSRLLTGAHIFGERGALNCQARDHYLALQEQGVLPLGPALSTPVAVEAGALADLQARAAAAEQDDDEDIDWVPAEPVQGEPPPAKAAGADAEGER